MSNFTFNNVRKSWVTILQKKRPYRSKLLRNILKVPGMAGGVLSDTDIEPLVIPVRIMIDGNSQEDYLLKTEELASWLSTDKPAPLIFDDFPNRTYYAVLNGSLDPDEIVSKGFVDIQFVCPDPYKYGAEQTAPLTGAPINITGTAKTDPIFTLELKEPTTFVAVGDGTEVNMVGSPMAVTETPFVREERKLWEQMNSFAGWTDSTGVEDGTVGGAMQTDGYSFFASNYGTGAGWHGPTKKKVLPEAIQDFQADVLLRQIGSHLQVGKVEVSFLDVNGNTVAKVSLAKMRAQNIAVYAYARAGSFNSGHTFMATRGAYDYVWQHFEGIFRIQRIGNQWEAYVNATRERGSLRVKWTDTRGLAARPIAQVQVQICQFGAHPATTTQRVDDIKVFKINQPGSNQIPYIGEAGDIIEFDHTKNEIKKNGLDITKDKAFIGKYFKLSPGISHAVVEPEGKIQSANVRWRPRWL